MVLESGDLFVFGGPSRRAYHGVPKVAAGTGDPDIGLGAGRFNVTLARVRVWGRNTLSQPITFPKCLPSASPDGKILGTAERGKHEYNKRTYEKPEVQRLGLLRDLTKFSFNGHRPY